MNLGILLPHFLQKNCLSSRKQKGLNVLNAVHRQTGKIRVNYPLRWSVEYLFEGHLLLEA